MDPNFCCCCNYSTADVLGEQPYTIYKQVWFLFFRFFAKGTWWEVLASQQLQLLRFTLQLHDVSIGQKSAKPSPNRSVWQIMARQIHQKGTLDFHDKYGNAVLASGATFRVPAWAYTATQTGVEWNLSPIGRVTPKEWRCW